MTHHGASRKILRDSPATGGRLSPRHAQEEVPRLHLPPQLSERPASSCPAARRGSQLYDAACPIVHRQDLVMPCSVMKQRAARRSTSPSRRKTSLLPPLTPRLCDFKTRMSPLRNTNLTTNGKGGKCTKVFKFSTYESFALFYPNKSFNFAGASRPFAE